MWGKLRKKKREIKGEPRGQVNLLGFVCRGDMSKQGKWDQCLVVGSILGSLFARGKNIYVVSLV